MEAWIVKKIALVAPHLVVHMLPFGAEIDWRTLRKVEDSRLAGKKVIVVPRGNGQGQNALTDAFEINLDISGLLFLGFLLVHVFFFVGVELLVLVNLFRF